MNLSIDNYDYKTVSLAEYTRLLFEFGVLINLRDAKTSQHNRKLVAITRLLDLINEKSEAEKVEWERRLQRVFAPSPYKTRKPKIDFGCKVGDVVIVVDTPHQIADSFGTTRKENIDVKCQIIRIDRFTIRLRKFETTIDDTYYKIARASKQKGYFVILWGDKLDNRILNCKSEFTLKDSNRIITINTNPEFYVRTVNLTYTNLLD